jgi:hypothetical protein
MNKPAYHTPNLDGRPFARTNPQTITQRAALIRELLPDTTAIADICCGDCTTQSAVYHQLPAVQRYCGLDIQPEVVAANRAQGLGCLHGDALDPAALRHFLDFDLIFFGPPLSVECDGHRLLPFAQVVPAYTAFATLLLGQLAYTGTLVCICPKTTTMGDIRHFYEQVKSYRPDIALRLIHDTFATITGRGEPTEPRHKYRELWFSTRLPDSWEFR